MAEDKNPLPTSDADLNKSSQFRDMTRWFDPRVLLQTGIQAVITSVFAQYADGRPLQALQDSSPPEIKQNGYDLRQELKKDDGIWVDYVADLGDGFDSTYAVAYLLAQQSLDIEGLPKALPRGQILIMGGDEVYPYASDDEYRFRMQNPYKFAFPDSQADGAQHPKVFLIPGNHDWYDGLKAFRERFCGGHKKLGSWVTQQHRSYFSIRLADNWWLWGFDSGVDNKDIDGPQEDYFKTIAKTLTGKANLIICASVPIWLSAEGGAGLEEMQKGVNRLANIARKANSDIQVHATISGDRHSYNRYRAKNSPTQFITAGGGGAFLHPTHDLDLTIPMPWMGKHLDLSLKTQPSPDYRDSEEEACYPSRNESRELVKANWKFPLVNKQFAAVIGGLYWLVAMLMQATGHITPACCAIINPMFILSILGLGYVFWLYADSKDKHLKLGLALLHTVFHAVVILLMLKILPDPSMSLEKFWGFMIGMVILGGTVGGLLWGMYLVIACYFFDVHHNDAFSALSSSKYRNFLRMHIKGDELTIYPIGVDEVPKRQGWMINPKNRPNNQNEPVVVPREPLKPKLIEGPIVSVRAERSASAVS